jgi:hypothetical protein
MALSGRGPLETAPPCFDQLAHITDALNPQVRGRPGVDGVAVAAAPEICSRCRLT